MLLGLLLTTARNCQWIVLFQWPTSSSSSHHLHNHHHDVFQLAVFFRNNLLPFFLRVWLYRNWHCQREKNTQCIIGIILYRDTCSPASAMSSVCSWTLTPCEGGVERWQKLRVSEWVRSYECRPHNTTHLSVMIRSHLLQTLWQCSSLRFLEDSKSSCTQGIIISGHPLSVACNSKWQAVEEEGLGICRG